MSAAFRRRPKGYGGHSEVAREPVRRVSAKPEAKTEARFPGVEVAPRSSDAEGFGGQEREPHDEGRPEGPVRERLDAAGRACGDAAEDSLRSSFARHHGARFAGDPARMCRKKRGH